MKIGYDAKRLFANRTGLGNYGRSLVQNIQHFYPENDYHLFAPEVKLNDITNALLDSKKFHTHESKSRLKSYWRSFSIVKDLTKTGIELYHGLSNELPFRINRSGIKSVVTVHDLIFKVYPQTYSLSERIIYDKKFRYACETADKIIAISENTKKDIVRFYSIPPEKIEVIYQVCNPLFYTLQTEFGIQKILDEYRLPQKYFLWVGTIEKRKNLHLIIDAYRHNATSIQIPLIIVGKGNDYKNECKKLIEQYSLQKYFIWLENLKNNNHLQSLYQQATALIYPSFYEGFGLPIAEALLCKTPVIAANTSSLREAGGPDSIYINPMNFQELNDAMELVLNNEEVSRKMSENGYVFAHNNFNSKLTHAQIMSCYQNTMNL